MMTDRAQIAHGLANYVRGDLLQVVPDMPLRIALGTIARMVETNPTVIDRFLTSPAMAMIVPAGDGGYDIIPALNALRDTMRETGALTLTIPSIPLITKGEQTMTFSPSDIDNLISRIGG